MSRTDKIRAKMLDTSEHPEWRDMEYLLSRLDACRDLADEFERKAKDLRESEKAERGSDEFATTKRIRLIAKAGTYEVEAKNLRAALGDALEQEASAAQETKGGPR